MPLHMDDQSHTTKKLGMTALLGLALGSLGVVYGDIGTSPLYAVNEIFFGHGHTQVNQENILGAIGLIVWALLLSLVYISLANRKPKNPGIT